METRAALLMTQPGDLVHSTVELDTPGPGEVLVEMRAAGLCHSDVHFMTGDQEAASLPYCLGHEGSGIVTEVGPGMNDFSVGDHVVASFIPACGRCRMCAQGYQHLCNNGALIRGGTQLDGTYRMHLDGAPVAKMALLGTFSDWQVFDQLSLVKVPEHMPFDAAALLACGVPTGWGSAVNGASVQAGDVVIVMGVGGVGINAVQGAAHVGARRVIAVDPVQFKREMALKLGATDAFADMDEAADFARELTDGQGADSAIVTVSVVSSEAVAQAVASVRKTGTVALTAQGSDGTAGIPVMLGPISTYQKRIQGVLYGNEPPRSQIPKLVELYEAGILKLDELITRRYPLDQVNQAYRDMMDGKNIRGVVDFAL